MISIEHKIQLLKEWLEQYIFWYPNVDQIKHICIHTKHYGKVCNVDSFDNLILRIETRIKYFN